jgi:VanZ family protein
MSSSVLNARKLIGTWWPVAFMLAVIAVESTEALGADHTSSMLRPVWQFFFGHVSDAAWESIHHILRKCGHFFGYGLVGLSWLRAWRRTLPGLRPLPHCALALLATAVVASADEFHQSFLPNRTSSLWDVLLDCTGALVLLLLASAIRRRPSRLAQAA